MLTSRETAALAADVLTILPSSAAVKRRTGTNDGLGGRADTYGTVATVVCRITPTTTDVIEKEIGSRLRSDVMWRVAFPAGTDIRSTDRLTIGTATYAVEAVRDGRSVEVERVVYCSKASS